MTFDLQVLVIAFLAISLRLAAEKTALEARKSSKKKQPPHAEPPAVQPEEV
jgi:hypothetical protein